MRKQWQYLAACIGWVALHRLQWRMQRQTGGTSTPTCHATTPVLVEKRQEQ